MLGVFYANQISMCLDPHLNLGCGWRAIKPGYALKYNIFTVDSKSVLLLWITYVISVLFLLCFSARLFIDALWSPAGKGLTSWLLFVMSNCEVVTLPTFGILGKVCCLIVSIPDICPFSYFVYCTLIPIVLQKDCNSVCVYVCVRACVLVCVCYFGSDHV